MPRKLPVVIGFDTFGSVVDWRTSLIDGIGAYASSRGVTADWPAFVDAWRGAYQPSMNRVRRGEVPWTTLDELHRGSLDQLIAEFGIKGFTEEDLVHINLGWHRLKPWPDAVPGLTRLKSKFIIGTMSNGNVRLLLNMAKFSGIPWDMIYGSDLFKHFKPAPEFYLGVAKMMNLQPDQVMLGAAHNGDLAAARSCGLMTAFFPRPSEYGPNQSRDYEANQEWDVVAKDIEDMATQLGA